MSLAVTSGPSVLPLSLTLTRNRTPEVCQVQNPVGGLILAFHDATTRFPSALRVGLT